MATSPASLGAYATISLEELGSAALMRRQDTKFVFSTALLGQLLAELQEHYSLLEVGGLVRHRYLTRYFDTAAFDLFNAHHRGMGERVKVRERQYLTTGQLFLEVKHRNNKGVTDKTRAEVRDWQEQITGAVMPDRLLGHVTDDDGEGPALTPTLWNAYQRITLVSKHRSERVTIDTDLTFSTNGSYRYGAEGAVVAEVKQPSIDRASPVMQRLRTLGVRPSGFSKYCIGVSLLRPDLRHNRFKPRLRNLKRLTEGGALDA
ncbi:MAG: polyphosphate polymerase domain-containing protein [Trueperaceae bacterium]